MKEGIFFESDINEHRLDARFDIANLALVDAADDIAIGFAFDCVFLETVVLQQGNPFFEFLATDDQFDAGRFFAEA